MDKQPSMPLERAVLTDQQPIKSTPLQGNRLDSYPHTHWKASRNEHAPRQTSAEWFHLSIENNLDPLGVRTSSHGHGEDSPEHKTRIDDLPNARTFDVCPLQGVAIEPPAKEESAKW
jgi:hypothetical protein